MSMNMIFELYKLLTKEAKKKAMRVRAEMDVDGDKTTIPLSLLLTTKARFSDALANQYVCNNGLSINLNGGRLQYKNNQPIEISPETKEMRFLKILLTENVTTNSIVQYWQIAKGLNLPNYRENNKTKKSYAEESGYARRDLRKVLLAAGMTDLEIEEMVVTKPTVGYAIRCLPLS